MYLDWVLFQLKLTLLSCYFVGKFMTPQFILVYLTRNPCAQSNSLKDMDWNPANWQPLIVDR